MDRPKLLAALAGASLRPSQPVFNHSSAGSHMFMSTLLIDDPNVADEASVVTDTATVPSAGATMPSTDQGKMSGMGTMPMSGSGWQPGRS